ncbi:MAG: hypothetical protein HYT07_04095 [Candidatus Levybacteria bacterium]|nr:hypothetical protein [Candidatus Levybacteria bacterium]
MIEQRATEKIHDIRDIRRQIVECLSGVNPKQGQEFNNLVKEVAKNILLIRVGGDMSCYPGRSRVPIIFP